PEPGCGGQIVEKRTRQGKLLFGCSNYPKCNYSLWNRPIAEPCPSCGGPFLVEKYSRVKGQYKACPDKNCSYKGE
ncbi:MAG: topoisomerase DNA-binding C4 zinc finger domain-containing protein, partial [Smithellaceae bacterium]|nr:topoisomerase DNA-binding C4 zinc finger domain-containing protein [Smithellaceae bacterium]